MAQPPFLLDQVQIEPGAAGTRLIDRDPATGSLRFRDAVVAGGIILQKLAGIGSIGNVYVVGKTGAGAHYTTIQSALDAVPSAASPTSPALILVLPGVYTETVNIVRNGVIMVALGDVVLQSALEATPNAVGNDHTLILSAQLGTIPQRILIEGFTITNAHDNKACVRITGGAGSQVGADRIVLRDCRLEANAAGGNRHLWATAVNNIAVEGGTWVGNALSLGLVEECVSFVAKGLLSLPAIQLDYDDTQALPAGAAPPVYHLIDCPEVALGSGLNPPVSGTVSAAAMVDVKFTNCAFFGEVDLTSNQGFLAFNSQFGTLTLRSTVAASLYNCGVAVVTVNAAATLVRRAQSGSAVFGAATQVAVVFDIPMPDTEYGVTVELDSQPNNNEHWWIAPKTAAGFTINFPTNQTLNARWAALRVDV